MKFHPRACLPPAFLSKKSYFILFFFDIDTVSFLIYPEIYSFCFCGSAATFWALPEVFYLVHRVVISYQSICRIDFLVSGRVVIYISTGLAGIFLLSLLFTTRVLSCFRCAACRFARKCAASSLNSCLIACLFFAIRSSCSSKRYCFSGCNFSQIN